MTFGKFDEVLVSCQRPLTAWMQVHVWCEVRPRSNKLTTITLAGVQHRVLINAKGGRLSALNRGLSWSLLFIPRHCALLCPLRSGCVSHKACNAVVSHRCVVGGRQREGEAGEEDADQAPHSAPCLDRDRWSGRVGAGRDDAEGLVLTHQGFRA